MFLMLLTTVCVALTANLDAAIGTSDTFQPVTVAPATHAAVLGLSSGKVITGSSQFPASFSGSTGHMGGGLAQWDNGHTAFIGFRLKPASFTSNPPVVLNLAPPPSPSRGA